MVSDWSSRIVVIYWVLVGRGDSVPNGVTGPQTNPLWDGSVLLLRSRELLLRAE